MKIDMHFHSKLSDGRLTTDEILEIAKKKKAQFVACSEHDVINTEFPLKAKELGIDSLEAVEISGTDFKHSQHLHLTAYSKKFSQEVHDVLNASKAGRQLKMTKQIELLKSNGFDISWDEFLEFYRIRGVNTDNFNSSHLSSFIFMNPENIKLIYKLTGEELDRDSFIKNCLKDEGKYPFVGAVTIPEYEPSLEKLGELALKDNAVLSLAHPNFKLTQEQFKNRIEYYLECGINAIEINSKASKSWVDLILRYRDKYSYIITFGSDCHFKDGDDKEHGNFLEMNPYVNGEIIDMNLYFLQKKTRIIKNMYLPSSLGGDLYDDMAEYAKHLKDFSCLIV